jgi:hypothetical protein
MTVGYNRLVGVNKISTLLGGKNLTISFDYLEDSIEKVSYNIEGQKFNLVIEPKPNFPLFDPAKVQYSHSGSTANLIIAIGGKRPQDFGQFYQREKKLFTQKTLINIDTSPNNSQFGQINLTDPTASSCSEITIALLQGLKIKISQDIANNLLLGLIQATNNFQAPNVTGDTFEAAAICMDYGARTQKPPPTPFQPKPVQPQISQSLPTPQPRLGLQPTPTLPARNSQPLIPHSQNRPLRKASLKKLETPKSKPSADWLKPKVYRGSTKV